MRCEHCGHELRDGEIYCEKCGKALQIVPDYNLLEDDILPDLLSETPVHGASVLPQRVDPTELRKRQRKKRLQIAAAIFAAVVLIALTHHFGAFQNDSEAEETAAVDPAAEENETGVQEEAVFDADVAFSVSDGRYNEDVRLELTSSDGSDIYYTLDGTDPTSHNGSLYEEPIRLSGGETTVRAACINDAGKVGKITEKVYIIAYEAPAMPTVSPESGTYHEETYVTVSSGETGATIYYTWDGTNPTTDSLQYTQPILIPEGNHVLAVIVIDAHGMMSDILRCNYVYLP